MADPLEAELRNLRQELQTLNAHRFVTVHNNMWRLLGFQFLRGIAMGLGTALGATLVVSIVAYALSQIEFVPIIGEWAGQIAEEMQATEE